MYSIEINLKKSNVLLFLIASIHLFALFCLLMLVMHWNIPVILTLSACLFILCSLYYGLSHYAFIKAKSAWTALSWNSLSACWIIQNNQKKHYKATLLSNSVITNRFLLLNFKVREYFFPQVLMLTSENTDKDDLRKLRVILKNGYANKKERSTISASS